MRTEAAAGGHAVLVPRFTLNGHRKYVRAVCFSPDARLVFSASDDHTAVVWDAVEGKLNEVAGWINALRAKPPPEAAEPSAEARATVQRGAEPVPLAPLLGVAHRDVQELELVQQQLERIPATQQGMV